MQINGNYWDWIYRLSWVGVVILCILILLSIFLPQIQKYRRYQDRIDELTTNIRREEEGIKFLKRQQELFAKSPRFVERLAHEIGMVKSNEVLFTFDSDSAPRIGAKQR